MAKRTSLKAKENSKKGGLAPRIFTEDERNIVKQLAVANFKQRLIAKAIQTDVETLTKYFGDVLEESRIRFDAFVMSKIAKGISEGNYKFIELYVRNNWDHWKPHSSIELSGKDGTPLIPVLNIGKEQK